MQTFGFRAMNTSVLLPQKGGASAGMLATNHFDDVNNVLAAFYLPAS